jgi:hypothetical protein
MDARDHGSALYDGDARRPSTKAHPTLLDVKSKLVVNGQAPVSQKGVCGLLVFSAAKAPGNAKEPVIYTPEHDATTSLSRSHILKGDEQSRRAAERLQYEMSQRTRYWSHA